MILSWSRLGFAGFCLLIFSCAVGYAAPAISYPLVSPVEVGGLGLTLQWVDDETIVFIGIEANRTAEEAKWMKWHLSGQIVPLKSIGGTDVTMYGYVCAHDGIITLGSSGVDTDGFKFRVVDRGGQVTTEKSKEKWKQGPGASLRGFDCLSAYDDNMSGKLWKPLLEKNRYLQIDEKGKTSADMKIIIADTTPYVVVDLQLSTDKVYPNGERFLKFSSDYFIRARPRSETSYQEVKPGEKCWKGWRFDANGKVEDVCVSIPPGAEPLFLSPVREGYVVGSDRGLHFYSKPAIQQGKIQTGTTYNFRGYEGGIYAMEVSPDGCKVAAVAAVTSGGRRTARLIVENFCN